MFSCASGFAEMGAKAERLTGKVYRVHRWFTSEWSRVECTQGIQSGTHANSAHRDSCEQAPARDHARSVLQLRKVTDHSRPSLVSSHAYEQDRAQPRSRRVPLAGSLNAGSNYRLSASRCSAWRRLVSVSFAPLSMRAISSRRSSSLSGRIEVCVRPFVSVFAIR